MQEFDTEFQDDDLLDLLTEEVTANDEHKQDDDNVDDLLSLLNDDLEDAEADDLAQVEYNDLNHLSFSEDYAENVEGVNIEYDVESTLVESNFDHSADEDSLDSVKDQEILESLQNELAQKGYKFLEYYDYEQLEALIRIEEFCENEDILEEQRNSLIENFDNIKNLIKTTNASFLKQFSAKSYKWREMPNVKTSLPQPFIEIIWDVILELLSKSGNSKQIEDTVNITKVTERVLDGPKNYKVYIESSEYYNYLHSVLPIAISNFKDMRMGIREFELQRDKTVSFLLQDEHNAMKDMEQGDIDFIKQIYKRSESYVYCCNNCNTESELKSAIVSYILYASEQGTYKPVLLPRMITCSCCGKKYMLPLTIYAEIRDNLDKVYKRGSSELFKYLNKVSTGTALTKITPTVEDMLEKFNFPDVGANIDERITTEDTKQPVEIFYDDYEYYEAIKAFNNRCLLFNTDVSKQTKNKTRDSQGDEFLSFETDDAIDELVEASDTKVNNLSYKDLVRCMIAELSLDYNTVKNKAIYSLIMAFNEVDCIKRYLHLSDYWNWKNQYNVLKNVEKYNENDKEMLSICNALYRQFNTESAKNLSELKDFLIKYREQIKETIKDFENKHAEILLQIHNNKDLYAHTKILNINQVSYSLLVDYLADKTLYAMVDDITDRMIVNNYAEAFSDSLFRGSILNSGYLRRHLLEISSGMILHKTIENFMDNRGIPFPYDIMERLYYVSGNHLVALRDAADALKEYDYYNFLKNLSELSDYNTLINLDADDKLRKASELAKTEFNTIKNSNYVAYNLCDFTEEELQDKSCRKELARINFGAFIPKRLPNETLSEYLKRYSELSTKDLLGTVECYDHRKEFDKFSDYFVVIAAGYNVLDLDSSNFALANFIRCWLYVCCECMSRSNALGYLGYSEKYFNRLKALDTNNYDKAFEESIFSESASLYRIWHGYYVNPVDEFLTVKCNNPANITLNEKSKIDSMLVPRISDIITAIEDASDSEICSLSSKRNKSDDVNRAEAEELENAGSMREDMINEIESYKE